MFADPWFKLSPDIIFLFAWRSPLNKGFWSAGLLRLISLSLDFWWCRSRTVFCLSPRSREYLLLPLSPASVARHLCSGHDSLCSPSLGSPKAFIPQETWIWLLDLPPVIDALSRSFSWSPCESLQRRIYKGVQTPLCLWTPGVLYSHSHPHLAFSTLLKIIAYSLVWYPCYSVFCSWWVSTRPLLGGAVFP